MYYRWLCRLNSLKLITTCDTSHSVINISVTVQDPTCPVTPFFFYVCCLFPFLTGRTLSTRSIGWMCKWNFVCCCSLTKSLLVIHWLKSHSSLIRNWFFYVAVVFQINHLHSLQLRPPCVPSHFLNIITIAINYHQCLHRCLPRCLPQRLHQCLQDGNGAEKGCQGGNPKKGHMSWPLLLLFFQRLPIEVCIHVSYCLLIIDHYLDG